MSALRDWYDGRVYPAEDISRGGCEFLELRDEFLRETEALRERLPEAERAQYEKLENLESQLTDHEIYAGFAYGFRMGLLLMGEALGFGAKP